MGNQCKMVVLNNYSGQYKDLINTVILIVKYYIYIYIYAQCCKKIYGDANKNLRLS